MIGTCSESISWFALFSHSTDVLTKWANQCKSPEMRCWSLNQVPNMSYGRFTTRHRKCESPAKKTIKTKNEIRWWNGERRHKLQCALTGDTEHSDFARCWMRRTEMHTRHQQQCVTLIELRKLRVLPTEFFHIVWVFNGCRIRWVPNLYANGEEQWVKCMRILRNWSHQNVSVFGARRKHASIVWKADVQHLMRMRILQFIGQHHWYIVGQSFVFIVPRFGTCNFENTHINETITSDRSEPSCSCEM